MNPHSIYLTFWPLIDVLSSFGFQVHATLLDGSNNNRYFMNMLVNPDSAHMLKYITTDVYDVSRRVALTQDCKHTLKKIHNSILGSSENPKAVCSLKINGKLILWDHFIWAYQFNNDTDLHLYRQLSRDHVYPSQPEKMRNHLATNVLNSKMLNLFKEYQQ